MIKAEFTPNSGYLVMDDSNDPIAVITSNANDKERDITDKVCEAIKEHLSVERVVVISEMSLSLEVGTTAREFDAIIIEDETNDEEDSGYTNTFRIQHITLY